MRLNNVLRLALVVVTLFLLMATGFVGAQDMSPYTISVEPIGHWHVFDAKVLIFTVHDAATGAGVEGLNLVVDITRTGSDRITTRSVVDGQIEEQGDGLYSLEYTPTSLGSYALVVHFELDDQAYLSAPVPFETARAGEEGIQAEGNDTTYVYQIRYNWEPGHVHANDTEPVTLTFELIRGIPTGDDINWDQPWQNAFDHVTDSSDARLILTSDDGTLSEELLLTYRGRGIYQVEHIFSVEEVGEGRDYQIQCVFTDNFNGAEVQLSEPAILHAVPSH